MGSVLLEKGKTMNDYIKREDALKAVDDIVCDADDAERTCDRIIDLPSADVVPVRHGRWSKEWGNYKCSLCEALDDFVDNYCPNCGAKMDEGECDDD